MNDTSRNMQAFILTSSLKTVYSTDDGHFEERTQDKSSLGSCLKLIMEPSKRGQKELS